MEANRTQNDDDCLLAQLWDWRNRQPVVDTERKHSAGTGRIKAYAGL